MVQDIIMCVMWNKCGQFNDNDVEEKIIHNKYHCALSKLRTIKFVTTIWNV